VTNVPELFVFLASDHCDAEFFDGAAQAFANIVG
jgi:hypothetical protein